MEGVLGWLSDEVLLVVTRLIIRILFFVLVPLLLLCLRIRESLGSEFAN